MILTDGSDERALIALQQLMREGRLLNRYDSQLFALRICPPSRRERALNPEAIRKLVEKRSSTKLLAELCEATGGYMRLVAKYEQGFEVLDEMIRARPKLTMKFQMAELGLYPRCFKESGIAVGTPQGNFLLKDGQFLAFSPINLSQRRLSRLPLPCRPPSNSKPLHRDQH